MRSNISRYVYQGRRELGFGAIVLAAILAIVVAEALADPSPQHPLDPLSRSELAAAVSALKAAGYVDGATRFAYVRLAETPKAEVLAWRPGEPVTRKAFVMIMEGARTYEAVVDIGAARVESWREVKEVQPSILLEEIQSVNGILRADPGWQAAMRKRGIDQFDKIQCMPFTAGYFVRPDICRVPR